MKRIVFVDNDASERQTFERIYAISGLEHPLLVLPSGEALIEYLGNPLVDFTTLVIFLDSHMEGLSGTETARRLCEDPGPRGRPRIIILSHSHDDREVAAALDAGAQEYVGKPRTVDKYLAFLNRFL